MIPVKVMVEKEDGSYEEAPPGFSIEGIKVEIHGTGTVSYPDKED